MKERQQNFELLRIIAMFMIVIFHAITYCVIEYELPITGLNDLLLTVLRALIYVCVNVFIIITGYFSVNTKQLKLRKVVNTALMPGFFSAILLTMVMVVGIEEFNFWQIIRKLFATFRGEYWFISNYFALYLFIPFLNKIVHRVSKKEFQHFLFLSVLIGVIWPFFVIDENIISFNSGFSLIFFILLYFVGAYIRLYGALVKDFSRNYYLIGYILLAVVTGVLQYTVPNTDFLNYNGPFEFTMSYLLFMYISKIKVKSVSVNTVAAYTFGVYLVHEQGEMRQLIWGLPIIHRMIQWSPITFIPVIILVSLIIFTICWIISFIFINIFERLENFIYRWLSRYKVSPVD